ncbi:unnamed protein product [Arabidopsis halleri]
MEPPLPGEETNLENDDLLGDELHDSLQEGSEQLAHAQSGSEKFPSSSRSIRSSIVAAESTETQSQQALVDVGSSITKEKKKKEPKKKEVGQTRRGPITSAVPINSASKKIQNIKGRSPSKRISLKAGSSRPRSSRRASSVPKHGVLPSSKIKSSVSSADPVGPSNPPDSAT